MSADALAERAALAIATAEADHAALQRAIAHMAGEAGRIAAAVEAEREACANLAILVAAGESRLAEFDGQPHAHGEVIAQEIATKIRARGGQ